jgi:hypothetical protein
MIRDVANDLPESDASRIHEQGEHLSRVGTLPIKSRQHINI